MPTCFVVMGYGVKTDFQQNKSFDLDKTYHYIIKPAVEASGYTCKRADEIQHAGVIDVPMYDQLLNADLVVADLSTANVNAFFELGVRYALRPGATIAVAEKGFKIPFDMGHVVIRHYEHLGPGIDHGEVLRMQQALIDACRAVPTSGYVDSPVYVFIKDLVAPSIKGQSAIAGVVPADVVDAAREKRDRRTQEALAHATTEQEKDALRQPLAALIEMATDARKREEFASMRDILRGVRAAQRDNPDPFVLQQLALATYKAKDRDAQVALVEAREVLKALDPESSSDPETLGLWGAIHKRLWYVEAAPRDVRLDDLSKGVWAYEKGFYLKNDYYNGINLAFLLNVRAKESAGEDAIADRIQARRVRERVLEICERLLKAEIKGGTPAEKLGEEYWIRVTVVEARVGLGKDDDETKRAFDEAKRMAPEPWMAGTTEKQLAELRKLLV